MIYLLVFIISVYFAHNAEKAVTKKSVLVYSVLSCFFPIILGGMRSAEVGTDNYLYLQPQFIYFAKFTSFLGLPNVLRYEFLYRVLTFILSRFSTDYHLVTFSHSIISMVIAYVGLYRLRKVAPLWFSLLAYYFLMYCPMLCYVRQGIALSFCILAVSFAYVREFIPFACFTAIAALFHTSAIVVLPFYFILRYLKKKNIGIKGFIVVIIAIIAFTQLGVIGNYLYRLGVFPLRYLKYLPSGIVFSFKFTVVRIPIVFLCFMLAPKFKKYDTSHGTELFCYFIFICLELIAVQLAGTITWAYRLAYYFMIYDLLLLPNVKVCFVKKYRITVDTFIILYLLFHWIFFTVYNKYGFSYPVYPYRIG